MATEKGKEEEFLFFLSVIKRMLKEVLKGITLAIIVLQKIKD